MESRTHKEDAPARRTSRSHVQRWQLRLLPLMSLMLVAAAVFFSVTSVYELRDFYGRVEQRPFNGVGEAFTKFEEGGVRKETLDLNYLSLKTRSLLEVQTLERRYQTANSIMLARVWTRQLGFITGMMLALVGAAFILGQLEDAGTEASVEFGSQKGSLASSSPGLVLSAIGAVLMGIALYIPFEINTYDVPAYLSPGPPAPIPPAAKAPADPTAPLPPPAAISNMNNSVLSSGSGAR